MGLVAPQRVGSSQTRHQTHVSCIGRQILDTLSHQGSPAYVFKCLIHCACEPSCFSCICLIATSQTIAHQAPLSMGFSRQKCWSGLPFPSPGDLPDPGMEPTAPALAGGFFTTELPRKLTFPYPHLVFTTLSAMIRSVCLPYLLVSASQGKGTYLITSVVSPNRSSVAVTAL